MGFQGSKKVKDSGNRNPYYTEYTTTNLYVEKDFGDVATEITVANDSMTDTIQISYDGATLHGDIKPAETGHFKNDGKSSIFIKATTGGETVRLWAW